jgi:hypothetical protein
LHPRVLNRRRELAGVGASVPSAAHRRHRPCVRSDGLDRSRLSPTSFCCDPRLKPKPWLEIDEARRSSTARRRSPAASPPLAHASHRSRRITILRPRSSVTRVKPAYQSTQPCASFVFAKETLTFCCFTFMPFLSSTIISVRPFSLCFEP